MKNPLFLLIIYSAYICITGCCNFNSTPKDSVPEKAVIFYESNTLPWGLLRIVDVSVVDYLQDSDKMSKIVLTNKDSLRYISNCIAKAQLNTIVANNYVDTAIAMLLYSQNNIDTLSIDGFPQGQIQYNGTVFRDSLFVHYIIDIIRAHDVAWDNKAKKYFYNETYNPLPESLLNEIH